MWGNKSVRLHVILQILDNQILESYEHQTMIFQYLNGKRYLNTSHLVWYLGPKSKLSEKFLNTKPSVLNLDTGLVNRSFILRTSLTIFARSVCWLCAWFLFAQSMMNSFELWPSSITLIIEIYFTVGNFIY